MKCSFSGKEIPPGKGITFVKSDGKVLHFFDSKSEKNYFMRKARNVRWTEEARKEKKERLAAMEHAKKESEGGKMIEKTLVLVKPDAVQRGLIGDIISRFERAGLKFIGIKMVYASKELAGKHYNDDEEWLRNVGEKAIASAKKAGAELSEDPMEIGNRVRGFLLDYITMSPVVAIAIEGHRAVSIVRKMVGSTNPLDSAPGTIRGDYTIDSYDLADSSGRPIQNLIHASGTRDEGEKEIALWFNDEELHAWKRVSEDLIYRNLQN